MIDQSLLKRVDIVQPIEDVISKACNEYSIGQLRTFKLLRDGYQELNIRAFTSSGDYVVKFFSKEKSLERIQDNIWGYLTFHKQGVPMPKLRKNKKGGFLLSQPGVRRAAYLCVMEYFEGTYLMPDDISEDDLKHLTKYMALIHTNTRRIGRYYDTMGIANFLSQYKKFNRYLLKNDTKIFKGLVQEYADVSMKKLRKCVIHGTFETENILKRGNKLCLLDLGCMDFNAAIFDIATFISNYTLDLSPQEKRRRIQLIVQTYQKTFPLTKDELHALPICVKAQYAVILLRTNYYRIKHLDTTPLTKLWYDRARRGLEQWSIISSI